MALPSNLGLDSQSASTVTRTSEPSNGLSGGGRRGTAACPLWHIEGLESLGTRDFRGTETARGLRTGQTGSRRILTLASLPAAWPWGILSFSFSSVKGDDDNMQLLQEVTREGEGDSVFNGDRASV